jgi:Leucine-rich repeat (LRR) protein
MQRNALSAILDGTLPPSLLLLDLSSNLITSLPPSLLLDRSAGGRQQALHTLDLSSNLITSLPAPATPPTFFPPPLARLLLGRNPLGDASVLQ